MTVSNPGKTIAPSAGEVTIYAGAEAWLVTSGWRQRRSKLRLYSKEWEVKGRGGVNCWSVAMNVRPSPGPWGSWQPVSSGVLCVREWQLSGLSEFFVARPSRL
jgi:hypothetical protein